MSLDRSPSPRREGGWASPGLTTPYTNTNTNGRSVSPGKNYGDLDGGSGNAGNNNVTWASAKANSARVQGYPSFQSQNQGFFNRHVRKISQSLPYFDFGASGAEVGGGSRVRGRSFAEKEKLQRGRSWRSGGGIGGWVRGVLGRFGLLASRRRRYLALFVMFLVAVLMWFREPLRYTYRRTSWLGGGSKYVLILAANQGGGVMEWKGPREWAIERDSVRNKKKYAAEWGYELEIVDMSTKKRYAHEWRESWEKVDTIRNAMRKYPDAEWFWWLDLNTFIMEPSQSLQTHIFSTLPTVTYRDINLYNPLKIAHPANGTSSPNSPYLNYLDPLASSPSGDNNPASINLLIPQDCSGFNLGSFFVKRSPWTDRLLDIWWDPVFYEQRHMQWEHKEQDALEYIYTSQPWIRPNTAFIPQRLVNAFPQGACGDDQGVPASGCPVPSSPDLPRSRWLTPKQEVLANQHGEKWECGVGGVHYQESERDFLVNMAGCEWGRDCWGEMYSFRKKSYWLNRWWWERFKDACWAWWRREGKAAKKAV